MMFTLMSERYWLKVELCFDVWWPDGLTLSKGISYFISPLISTRSFTDVGRGLSDFCIWLHLTCGLGVALLCHMFTNFKAKTHEQRHADSFFWVQLYETSKCQTVCEGWECLKWNDENRGVKNTWIEKLSSQNGGELKIDWWFSCHFCHLVWKNTPIQQRCWSSWSWKEQKEGNSLESNWMSWETSALLCSSIRGSNKDEPEEKGGEEHVTAFIYLYVVNLRIEFENHIYSQDKLSLHFHFISHFFTSHSSLALVSLM